MSFTRRRQSAVRSVLLVGRVEYVRAAHQLVSHHGIHGKARLVRQQLCGLALHVVDGDQVEQVGALYVIAVLFHGAGHRGHVQFVAGRRHAFGQGHKRLRELRKLSPLHGTAVASGDGAFLAELIVHKIGARKLQQHFAVKFLDFRRQIALVYRLILIGIIGTGIGGHAVAGIVYHVARGKQLDVDILKHSLFSSQCLSDASKIAMISFFGRFL